MNANERKTKKMAEYEREMERIHDEIGVATQKKIVLTNFEPTFGASKKLQDEYLEKFESHITGLSNTFNDLRSKLQVATIEMLAGLDTDFEEPTPVDAIRQAS